MHVRGAADVHHATLNPQPSTLKPQTSTLKPQTSNLFPYNPHDTQQVSREAEHGGNNDTAGGEHIGAERLWGAFITGHESHTGDDKPTGHQQDEAVASVKER